VCDTSYTDYFYNWRGITHVCSQSIQHLYIALSKARMLTKRWLANFLSISK